MAFEEIDVQLKPNTEIKKAIFDLSEIDSIRNAAGRLLDLACHYRETCRILIEVRIPSPIYSVLHEITPKEMPAPPVKRAHVRGVKHCYSVVKIAHHGSLNGLGAEVFTMGGSDSPTIDYGIITPYCRSGLPTSDMARKYKKACARLVHTLSDVRSTPRQPIPGLSNARVPNKRFAWIGIEISDDGLIRKIQ